MDIEAQLPPSPPQAPQNQNENENEINCMKAAQLFLAGASLAISIATLSSSKARHLLLICINYGLNWGIAGMAAYTGRIPLIHGFCWLPLVELMALGSSGLSFLIALESYQQPPRFHIPSMCLGISIASFMVRLQDMLAIIFGVIIYPNPPLIPAPVPPVQAPPAIQDNQAPSSPPAPDAISVPPVQAPPAIQGNQAPSSPPAPEAISASTDQPDIRSASAQTDLQAPEANAPTIISSSSSNASRSD